MIQIVSTHIYFFNWILDTQHINPYRKTLINKTLTDGSYSHRHRDALNRIRKKYHIEFENLIKLKQKKRVTN